ncbi:amidohydrolase family protein [Evansella sp. AB-P1]|uniref:N-acetylglucosamine-6-phosphate deacetylase n=1 Tax=Evansella sp. AB-P1 TaxID=3037653 RepID=UPI00241DBC92|nr:amidohydrolase family protein [Evansella sp. AB-P1]MDG5788596.1 amidohydrolase family protein [Evansella sp. AB-P1]
MEKIKGIHYESGKNIEVCVEDGIIASINEIREKCNSVLAPGLVDIQVNGFMGIDFNDRPLQKNEWNTILIQLAKVGVTTFFPTIITNSFENLAYLFEVNVKQLKTVVYNDMVGGFHLEGPYISPMDGPRGAHSREYVRPPDWNEFCHLQEKACGMIKLVTLSPEWEEAVDFIKRATESGVKVAIGHTSAATNEIRKAVEAGAIISTHLGNGAHPQVPRHPNYIWDQLAEESLWASVIADGFHLPSNVLHVFNKIKKDNMILVSDSVSLAGMKPGDYSTSIGGEVTLTKENKLHIKDNSTILAGSAHCLLQGVQYLVEENICHIGEAFKKASIFPMELMGIPSQKGIQIGAPADFIVLSLDDWKVKKTYKGGELIYEKPVNLY